MKQAIITTVIQRLEAELERQTQANMQLNAATSFSAVNADKQRDTTGMEAAFLAHGYAKRGLSLVHQLEVLRALSLEDFTGQEIDVGALVEVELAGEADYYFLLHCAGGMEIETDGRTVTIITPESPLGKELIGKVEASFLTLPSGLEGIILSVV